MLADSKVLPGDGGGRRLAAESTAGPLPHRAYRILHTALGHVLDQLPTGPPPGHHRQPHRPARVYGPCDWYSSGRFSVRSPRSRRQGFAYSAGSRESSSRCTQPPPARLTASARTLLPGFGAVPLGADDATEGNEPHHLTNRRRRALTGPPYGTAPVPRGSREPPPEAPALHQGS